MVQVPWLAVSVEPTVALPLIPGAAVLIGGPPTTAVAAELAEFDPAELVAVTTTASVVPMSLVVTEYVELVSELLVQFAPAESQVCH